LVALTRTGPAVLLCETGLPPEGGSYGLFRLKAEATGLFRLTAEATGWAATRGGGHGIGTGFRSANRSSGPGVL